MKHFNYRGLAISEMKNGDKWIKTDSNNSEVYLNHSDKLAYINGIPVLYKTVSQCTGVKDKHGFDVFEGDIVKFDPLYERLCVIKLTPYSVLAKDGYDKWTLGWFDEIELVGNMFENKELMEGIF